MTPTWLIHCFLQDLSQNSNLGLLYSESVLLALAQQKVFVAKFFVHSLNDNDKVQILFSTSLIVIIFLLYFSTYIRCIVNSHMKKLFLAMANRPLPISKLRKLHYFSVHNISRKWTTRLVSPSPRFRLVNPSARFQLIIPDAWLWLIDLAFF